MRKRIWNKVDFLDAWVGQAAADVINLDWNCEIEILRSLDNDSHMILYKVYDPVTDSTLGSCELAFDIPREEAQKRLGVMIAGIEVP